MGPMENKKFVKYLMKSPKYGILAEAFVIDAIGKLADAVSKANPKQFERSLVHGPTWIALAKEIKEKFDKQYEVTGRVKA